MLYLFYYIQNSFLGLHLLDDRAVKLLLGGHMRDVARYRRSATNIFLAVTTGCALCGCGSFVPEIEEFWGAPVDVSVKVNAITAQVKCELREAVAYLHERDRLLAKTKLLVKDKKTGKLSLDTKLDWLDNWSAQVTLTLNILESTALNPGLTLNTPLNNANTRYGTTTVVTPQSYSFGLGGTLSSAATRIDTITALYNLAEFSNAVPTDRTCIPETHANGDLFIQSDLKLKQWLSEAVLPLYTTTIDKFPTKPISSVKNGFLSHEVKFQIVSNGNATPTWKLVHVSANAGNLPLFATSRDRTQDLQITMGPTQSDTSGTPTLSPAALNAALAAQIGLAVSSAIKGSQ